MKKNLFTAALVSIFLLGGMVFTAEAKADPLDKSSPKIAHGMYRDRGKSSPKIAHGIRTPSADANDNLIFMVEMALEIGDVELADELVDKILMRAKNAERRRQRQL